MWRKSVCWCIHLWKHNIIRTTTTDVLTFSLLWLTEPTNSPFELLQLATFPVYSWLTSSQFTERSHKNFTLHNFLCTKNYLFDCNHHTCISGSKNNLSLVTDCRSDFFQITVPQPGSRGSWLKRSIKEMSCTLSWRLLKICLSPQINGQYSHVSHLAVERACSFFCLFGFYGQ